MNSFVQKKLKQLWRSWDEFWFSNNNIYNAGLFRMLFGIVLLGLYLNRFLDFELFYLNNGLMSIESVKHVLPEANRSFLPFYLTTDSGILLQGYLHLLLIALFTLGAFGRSLTWVLFVVNLGLLQRDPIIIYGADLFANFWLFYFSLIQHNQFFSIWNLISKNKKKRDVKADMVSSAAMRMLQVHLCVAYAITGWEKLKGTTWWDGTAVWHMLGMKELVERDLSFLHSYPVFVGTLTLATLIFEIYFCFAVWNKKLRYSVLLVGVVFHIGTAIIIDLWYFCFVMILPYVLFLPDLKTFFLRAGTSLSSARTIHATIGPKS